MDIDTVRALHRKLADSSLYDRIGVSPGASAAEIRVQFISRVRELHPDVHYHRGERGVAEELEKVLMLLNESRDVLSNPLTRREYDRKLTAGEESRSESTLSEPERRKVQAETRFKEAVHAMSLGAVQHAVTLLRTAVHLQPDEYKYRVRLAEALLASDELHDARKEAKRASELNPSSLETILVQARVYEKAGLRRNAIREYRRALQIDTGHEQVTQRLKVLEAEEAQAQAEADEKAGKTAKNTTTPRKLLGRLFGKK